ncbi:MAG TPA: ATP-binding protein [Candidatus Binatia bacterium]|nr:ATP-binding protein [Candidatus Binatia bacterium]
MTESAESKTDVSLEALIRDDAVPLESILCTEELRRRTWRPPDYGKENAALVALVSALADSPHTILQTLAEKVLEVLQADSSGLSLLTKDKKRFYWAAIAGAWQPHIGGGTPRNFGPCGDVLDCNVPMLFTHWERRYPYLRPAIPLAEEGLLVPFYVNGEAVGTIWAIAHNDLRKFDAEDLRLLESLGRFASAAYQTVASIDELKFQIAEREKAEAALQELAKGLEAKVRRLVDSNIIGIAIWNFDGRIIEANEAFLRIVGYGREDLVSGGVSWREVTPNKWREADERALAELAATGICEPFEKEYFRKDGSRVPVLVGAALLEGSRDEGVAFVLDLTERKLAEEALHKTQAELAHVTRVTTLGEMAASMAHEINQPLSAIVANGSACLRWLAGDNPNLDEARGTAQRVIRDGNRASQVITRIRALVRKADFEKAPLDINQAVQEVINLTQHEAVQKAVALRTELAGELPLVLGDRVQLQQVILNLIINGVEAMSSVADRSRELLVYSRQHGSDQVLIAVQDSGVGIDQENLKKIFDPFYTTKSQGMGMGLAISRSIVENHGGRLWAVSNEGPGTTFQFTISQYR